MKANANLSRTLVVLAVGLLVAVGVALFGVGLRSAETQTTAPTYYKVQALGTLPGDTAIEPYSSPHGINDFGHVVGEASFSGSSEGMNATAHAFLYKDGEMQDLGVLASGENRISYAKDINDFDKVVGYSENDYSSTTYNTAFLYQNEEMIDLGTRLHPDNNGNVWAQRDGWNHVYE